MKDNNNAPVTTTAQSSQQTSKPLNEEGLFREIVKDYMVQNPVNLPMLLENACKKAEEIHDDLLATYRLERSLSNTALAKGEQLNKMSKLPGGIAAQVILATGDVRVMLIGSSGYRIITKKYYRNASTGWRYKWAGSWQIVSDEKESISPIMKIFRRLCPNPSSADIYNFRNTLRDADIARATLDKMLVFYRNGVWNYRDRSFTAYDAPDYDAKYPTQITLRKLPVYHPLGYGAVLTPNPDGSITEPVIHNDADGTDWSPGQMLRDPFDMNTDVGRACNLIIWQAMQFMIRKMNSDFGYYHFWIDSDGRGRNGKGTIWDMMHRLIEKPIIDSFDDDLDDMSDVVAPIPVDQLSENYLLAQYILTAYAIVGEESDGTVTYIDRCSIAKMLARKQEMTFRIIREAPFKVAYDGFLLQQSNRAPVFSEKNDSVISHIIVLPFMKHFDGDRSYIKSDYVLREEVAEWLVYMLTVQMDALVEYDAAALKVLEPFKHDMMKNSMTTFQFLDDVLPGLPLNFIPSELLYSLYQRWCEKNGINGKSVVSARIFREDLEQYGLNNNHNVVFTADRTRVSEIFEPGKTDIKEEWKDKWIPALSEYGYSERLKETEWSQRWYDIHHSNSLIHSKLSRLNFAMFRISGNNKPRQFCRGGLKRITSYDAMGYKEYSDEEN